MNKKWRCLIWQLAQNVIIVMKTDLVQTEVIKENGAKENVNIITKIKNIIRTKNRVLEKAPIFLY